MTSVATEAMNLPKDPKALDIKLQNVQYNTKLYESLQGRDGAAAYLKKHAAAHEKHLSSKSPAKNPPAQSSAPAAAATSSQHTKAQAQVIHDNHELEFESTDKRWETLNLPLAKGGKIAPVTIDSISIKTPDELLDNLSTVYVDISGMRESVMETDKTITVNKETLSFPDGMYVLIVMTGLHGYKARFVNVKKDDQATIEARKDFEKYAATVCTALGLSVDKFGQVLSSFGDLYGYGCMLGGTTPDCPYFYRTPLLGAQHALAKNILFSKTFAQCEKFVNDILPLIMRNLPSLIPHFYCCKYYKTLDTDKLDKVYNKMTEEKKTWYTKLVDKIDCDSEWGSYEPGYIINPSTRDFLGGRDHVMFDAFWLSNASAEF